MNANTRTNEHADTRVLALLIGLLVLFAIASADAATRPVPLKKENPLLGKTTLLLANAGLVLIALVQVVVQVAKRRNKYKLAATTPPPPVARTQAPPLARGPAPSARPMTTAPPPASPPTSSTQRPATPPPVQPSSPRVVRCGTCGISLKVSAARFKCPKCATIGVVA